MIVITTCQLTKYFFPLLSYYFTNRFTSLSATMEPWVMSKGNAFRQQYFHWHKKEINIYHNHLELHQKRSITTYVQKKYIHSGWKSLKKSPSTLRAKQAKFTFLIKNTKIGLFWWVFENLKLALKQCYQTGQF